MIADVIEEFGNSLGMNAVRPDDSGLVAFEFRRTGELHMQQLDDDLLITLVRSYDRFQDGLLDRVLEQCDPKYHREFKVNAGLTADDRLTLTVRLDERQVELSAIEQVIDYLAAMFDRLGVE